MRTFGLIGYPLGHSFSKKYFTEKFQKESIPDCEYNLYPIENISQLPELIKEIPGLSGLNVTIPYKEQVLSYLTELDKTAASIKAVNCIKISNKSDKIQLKGYNTDCYGFESSLVPLLKDHHKKALILGTGGASKAVEYVLNNLNIKCMYVSRTARQNIFGYNEIDRKVLEEYTVIINGSPIGMAPNINHAPDLPYEYISKQHLLYDLVYNPENTLFMQKGYANGATVCNGLAMLHSQAEKAWEIWNEST